MATILIVEDQHELRRIHSAFLSHRGFEVVTARDGSDGLAAAKARRPDLIVLDHTLPGRTGLEVAAELRRDPALACVPIVMLTGHPYAALGERAREAGCDAFISKPCQPSRLLAEIERLAPEATAA